MNKKDVAAAAHIVCTVRRLGIYECATNEQGGTIRELVLRHDAFCLYLLEKTRAFVMAVHLWHMTG